MNWRKTASIILGDLLSQNFTDRKFPIKWPFFFLSERAEALWIMWAGRHVDLSSPGQRQCQQGALSHWPHPSQSSRCFSVLVAWTACLLPPHLVWSPRHSPIFRGSRAASQDLPRLDAQHNEFVPTEPPALIFQNLQYSKRETFVQISWFW